jgi:hypothetical protein
MNVLLIVRNLFLGLTFLIGVGAGEVCSPSPSGNSDNSEVSVSEWMVAGTRKEVQVRLSELGPSPQGHPMFGQSEQSVIVHHTIGIPFYILHRRLLI